MGSSDYLTGLYVAVPIYFVLIALSVVWAYKRMEQLKHDGVADQLTAHYLGGRSFGPILSAGTVFASLFSGYTVVGIPNEAYKLGYFALRWLVATCLIVYFYAGTGVRLRKASLFRNHQSSVDFITDRYQSQLLRYTVLVSQAINSIIYVAAQVIAVKTTFNAIFDIDPDSPWSVVIVFAIILLFEWVGGLSSVAFTDCVQGFIMVISFLIIPCVVKKNFGGWTSLNPETYPKPELYQTMTKEQQWKFWQFNAVGVSFFTIPHFITRVYSARDLKSLKFAWSVMCIGPWLTMFVGVFLGIVGVQMLDGEAVSSPFSSILEKIMALGGFAKGTGIIAFTASLAAIMSTADSLVIAISQLFTAEVIYPLRPQATPAEVAWYGRFVSLIAVVFSLSIGLTWDSGITDLVGIQFPIALQAVPAFLFGLFATHERYDVHPWSLAISGILGMIYVTGFYFGYIRNNADALPIDCGNLGLLINAILLALCEFFRRFVFKIQPINSNDVNEIAGVPLLYPNRPKWDIPRVSRFGEHPLTPKHMNKAMEGFREPFRNLWCTFFVLFSVTLATPLVAENEPPLDADGAFVYLPKIIRGIPWWAFRTIMLAVVPYLLVFIVIQLTPDDYPVDEDKIATKGIDPDLMELTPKEMGRRTSYDEKNTLASLRRRSIIRTMEELGIREETEEDAATKKVLIEDSNRRLSALVLGRVNEIADPSAEMEAGAGAKAVSNDSSEE